MDQRAPYDYPHVLCADSHDAPEFTDAALCHRQWNTESSTDSSFRSPPPDLLDGLFVGQHNAASTTQPVAQNGVRTSAQHSYAPPPFFDDEDQSSQSALSIRSEEQWSSAIYTSTPQNIGLMNHGDHLTSAGVLCIPIDILGSATTEIGQGGQRGSRVYRVDCRPPELRESAVPGGYSSSDSMAMKRYPLKVPENELLFIHTTHASRISDEEVPHWQELPSGYSSPSRVSMRAASHSWDRHLALTEAVVTENDKPVALLMPLYRCSLKQLLLRADPKPIESTDDCSRRGCFLTGPRFAWVESTRVIAAIAFQVLQAIGMMNHQMPHSDGSTRYDGFTHNDIHLDNILVSRDGRLALCDFELVHHLPPGANELTDHNRLPPHSRRSPHGLFSPSADTWAFGLLILNLLTGVDPLFSNEILMDDFGEGPLLQPYSSQAVGEGSPAVLDWEGNIREWVVSRLIAQDPSGQRAVSSRGLLEVCSRCLVNRPGASQATALELLQDDLFADFHRGEEKAHRIVHQWSQDVEARRRN